MMEDKQILEKVDIERWRLNAGTVSYEMQNNLFMYGSILHKNIAAVHAAIDVENKVVDYKIYCPQSLLKTIALFQELRTKKSLWSLWRLSRLLKKEGNLDFEVMLNNYVGTLCGAPWKAKLELLHESLYSETEEG